MTEHLLGIDCPSVAVFLGPDLAGKIECCRNRFAIMRSTQVLNHVIQKLSFSVPHNVLWRAVEFYPLSCWVLSCCGILLAVGEMCHPELAAVLLEIDITYVFMTDSFEGG